MPRGDRTGPAGMGSRTGRAAGYCAGYPTPGFANPIPGRGYGYGFGRGMGFGFRGGRGGGGRWAAPYAGNYGYGAPFAAPAYPPPAQEQELDILRDQAEFFEKALAELKERIAGLEVEKPKE